MSLKGKIVEIGELDQSHKVTLYQLMNSFYDDLTSEAFYRDLDNKDHCILLLNQFGSIVGFSTQVSISLEVEGRQVAGVFSGDTIIHPDYWGSLELFKVFTKQYILGRNKADSIYWFLISKGYKTYKMLPLFFNEFYPNYRVETPEFEQKLMNEFGKTYYPEEYNLNTGVIHYKGIKDKLKEGVADVTERQLKDPDVAFFLRANPEYGIGNDLVCVTYLSEDNLNYTAKRLLLGKDKASE